MKMCIHPPLAQGCSDCTPAKALWQTRLLLSSRAMLRPRLTWLTIQVVAPFATLPPLPLPIVTIYPAASSLATF
eukprot:4105283-Amphidinium_carterae.1